MRMMQFNVYPRTLRNCPLTFYFRRKSSGQYQCFVLAKVTLFLFGEVYLGTYRIAEETTFITFMSKTVFASNYAYSPQCCEAFEENGSRVRNGVILQTGHVYFGRLWSFKYDSRFY